MAKAGLPESQCAPRGALIYRPCSGHGLEEVSVGLMAYLDPRGEGDRSMPGNPVAGSSGQGRCAGGTRVIWRKLDYLNHNLQLMQVPIRRKDC